MLDVRIFLHAKVIDALWSSFAAFAASREQNRRSPHWYGRRRLEEGDASRGKANIEHPTLNIQR